MIHDGEDYVTRTYCPVDYFSDFYHVLLSDRSADQAFLEKENIGLTDWRKHIMQKFSKLSRKRKCMLGIFVLSVICVCLYLGLLIPHSITSEMTVQENLRMEEVVNYPLSFKTYFVESLKILCIINIPNIIIVMKKLNRSVVDSFYGRG